MSSDFYLRMLIPGDKELKITPTTITATATQFSSQLVLGYSRRHFAAYNNSDSASGECYWGGSGVTPTTGMPIPKGAIVDLPFSTDIDLYFVADTGEIGDLRVVEVA